MDTKTFLTISEARKKLFKIADDVIKTSRHYTLTDRGKPKVVLMSAEEFESWEETLEVMRDFPDLKKDIEEAERDYKSGKCVPLEDVLREEGFLLIADKPKKKYVPCRIKPESKKRFKENR